MKRDKVHTPVEEPFIRINGVDVETHIDINGVRRLPRDCIIESLREHCQRTGLGLNGLWMRAQAFANQEVSAPDLMRPLYQRMGYSVDGYVEIFPDDEIEYPEKEEEAGDG